MFDMHIQIDAPEVAEALNRLADALNAQTEVIRGGIPEIPATPKKTEAAQLIENLAAITKSDGADAAFSALANAQVQTIPNDAAAAKPAAPEKPAAPVAAAPAQSAIPTAAPQAAAAAPVSPVATAPAKPENKVNVTLNDIMRAGQLLMDSGKQDELLSLLPKYGVLAVSQLKPEQYDTFVAELRALGAKI